MPAEGGHASSTSPATGFAALDAMVRPRSVAVIGASDDATRIGGRPIAYMLRQGFQGVILPVNPNRATVQGLAAFASVAALPEVPDVAIVAVPGEAAVQAVEDLGARGCRAAIVFTAGFAEVDEAGQAAQERMVAAARRHGMRILGPNCLGLFNAAVNFYPMFSLSFEQGWPLPGNIGIASQSGAYGTHVFAVSRARGLGTPVCVTTGNESDVSLGEVIGWMAQAPEVEVICAYAEGIRESARFVAALDLARRNRKPVVMMKVGRSELGGQAARSHTASIAGDDAVTQAVLDEFGVVRAATTEQMLDIAYAASRRIYPARNTLGVITVSGGAGRADLGCGGSGGRADAADARGGAGAPQVADLLLRAAQPGGLHRAGGEPDRAVPTVPANHRRGRRLCLDAGVPDADRRLDHHGAEAAALPEAGAGEVPRPALGALGHRPAGQGEGV